MRTLLRTVIQVLFFIIVAKISDAFAAWIHSPIPGTIIGIAVLFILLKFKVIRMDWIEQGSNWLLAEMLLFFIPAAVGIINYKSLVVQSGLRLTITILLSTLAVMICTGLISQRLASKKEGNSEC
ncbi:CidA/LrgA family holin-like protein [Paenibacillus terrigena]|uniref:CidA/LrgA family protein n=1 Tax=Paenibacillus terrigena TaxID=369333 RepID=UPI0028D1523B|nr:CidA/LrgA family holin-like protein [Paenibacillus terrigena]